MQLYARDLHRTGEHEYLLGHSTQEQRRLAEQGLMLQPITERLFRDAGLRRGMRVLDVGCGVGDVTCLAAEIVGSQGAVVGVDFAGAVLSTARSRAASRGLTWARFIEAGLPEPESRLEGMIVAGPDVRGFRWLAELVRSTIPAMERFGVATAEDIEIDTLADRLVEEAEASPGSVCGLALGGAWVRTPMARLRRNSAADGTVLKGSWPPPSWPADNNTSSERQGRV